VSDNKNDSSPAEEGRIRLSEPSEVERWMRELRCSEAELVDAVLAVGTSALAVRHYFSRRDRGPV
jgi:hypothetical protein